MLYLYVCVVKGQIHMFLFFNIVVKVAVSSQCNVLAINNLQKTINSDCFIALFVATLSRSSKAFGFVVWGTLCFMLGYC